MNVLFTPTAWEQYTDWQREDKKIVKRINLADVKVEESILEMYRTKQAKKSKKK